MEKSFHGWCQRELVALFGVFLLIPSKSERSIADGSAHVLLLIREFKPLRKGKATYSRSVWDSRVNWKETLYHSCRDCDLRLPLAIPPPPPHRQSNSDLWKQTRQSQCLLLYLIWTTKHLQREQDILLKKSPFLILDNRLFFTPVEPPTVSHTLRMKQVEENQQTYKKVSALHQKGI